MRDFEVMKGSSSKPVIGLSLDAEYLGQRYDFLRLIGVVLLTSISHESALQRIESVEVPS